MIPSSSCRALRGGEDPFGTSPFIPKAKIKMRDQITERLILQEVMNRDGLFSRRIPLFALTARRRRVFLHRQTTTEFNITRRSMKWGRGRRQVERLALIRNPTQRLPEGRQPINVLPHDLNDLAGAAGGHACKRKSKILTTFLGKRQREYVSLNRGKGCVWGDVADGTGA